MNREKRLDIRLSSKEHCALEILSKRERRKLSELAQEVLQSGIQARGFQIFSLVDGLYSLEARQDANYEG
jgi:hypothetical protein